MLFNSYPFLLFLFTVVPIFFWLAHLGTQYAMAWLATASLGFYAIGESLSAGTGIALQHTLIVCSSIAFNYAAGLAMYRTSNYGTRRCYLLLAVFVDLLLLAYFKYANFLLTNAGLPMRVVGVVLPLGISFYTFTQIAYLVDISRGRVKEFSAVKYLLFVTYFPHLIAGPIIHHAEMIPQFSSRQRYRFSSLNLAIGISIFALGLAKKLFVADGAAPYADRAFAMAGQESLGLVQAWVGALAYTVQIYFDFSGYSDMAIGLSKMLGFSLPLNFNSPYKADCIIDFWRRWHMTLSRFLRDYVYIPLGGNRHGVPRRYMNLLLTMLIGGLWHGASWTFMVWGGLHGVYLVINHCWRKLGIALPRGLAAGTTFLAVVLAWVFFRADSTDKALAVIRAMLGLHDITAVPGPSRVPYAEDMLAPMGVLVSVGLPLLAAWTMPNVQQLFAKRAAALGESELPPTQWSWHPRLVWALLCGGMLSLCMAAMGGNSPFLYFRF